MIQQDVSILLVDDSKTCEKQVRHVLKPIKGLHVAGVMRSYDEASRWIEKEPPHLLILEIGIRSGNGMEFIRKTRLHHPDIRILVYTDQDEQLYAERALRVGAHGYLAKSAEPRDLQTAVDTLLQGNLYVSPLIEDKILRHIAEESDPDKRDPEIVLSNRELEIFVKIGKGLSSRDIAEQLGLSVKTIETHRAHIKRKLNVTAGGELVHQATEWVAHTHP